jgi:hypothetical protein
MTASTGHRWGWIAGILYVTLLVAGVASLFAARRSALKSLGTSQELQAWEQWREEARRQDGTTGSVQRRAPSRAEPPALILLRDHFGTCVFGAIFLTTILYWSTVLFVRGALFGPKFEIDDD